jgi:hypothetical protein
VVFSYKGDSETIAEGKFYRALLDPPDGGTTSDETAKKSGRHRGRKFVFIAVAAVAGAAAFSIPFGLSGSQREELFVSPSRP